MMQDFAINHNGAIHQLSPDQITDPYQRQLLDHPVLHQLIAQGLYPEKRYFWVTDHGDYLHYLDTDPLAKNSNMPTLVCVHGNPSWSFLFRQFLMIPNLPFRVIAMDHVGMGLSSRPKRQVSFEEHEKNVVGLLQKLELDHIFLMVHDWGGPLGFAAALKGKFKVQKIIMLNSAIGVPRAIPYRIRWVSFPWWNKLLNGTFPCFTWGAGWMSTPVKLDPLIKKGFAFPYQKRAGRLGVTGFLSDIPWSRSHYLYSYLEQLRHQVQAHFQATPCLIDWGLQDFCFNSSYYHDAQTLFPHAETYADIHSGHWLFEGPGAAKHIHKIISFLGHDGSIAMPQS